ncbi:MAG: hypothetical protein BWY76_01071 [bacterium ADurb.Bin429]|nr:MAG: hypothetical protein BWY76_01071 [bacterium ADurb.Bin429]
MGAHRELLPTVEHLIRRFDIVRRQQVALFGVNGFRQREFDDLIGMLHTEDFLQREHRHHILRLILRKNGGRAQQRKQQRQTSHGIPPVTGRYAV